MAKKWLESQERAYFETV